MKITARKSKSHQHARHFDGDSFKAQGNRDLVTELSSDESSLKTIDRDKGIQPESATFTFIIGMPVPHSLHTVDLNNTHTAELSQRTTRAQQELQYVAGRDEESERFVRDGHGINLLLQAAKVIDDRERAQMHQEARRIQVDASSDDDMEQSPGRSDHDEDARFNDDSEFHWLSNTPPPQPPEAQMPSTSPRTRPISPTFPAPSHKRRRSERLASATTANLAPTSSQPFPSTPPSRLARGAQSEPKHTSSTTHSAKPSTSSPNRPTPQRRIQPTTSTSAGPSTNKRKRPKWPASIRSYVEEQQAKRQKTLEWLEAQEGSEEEEEKYDEGVMGGRGWRVMEVRVRMGREKGRGSRR